MISPHETDNSNHLLPGAEKLVDFVQTNKKYSCLERNHLVFSVAFTCILRCRANVVAYQPFMQQLRELESMIQAQSQAQQSFPNDSALNYMLPIDSNGVMKSVKRSFSTWDPSEHDPAQSKKMRSSSSPTMEEEGPIEME